MRGLEAPFPRWPPDESCTSFQVHSSNPRELQKGHPQLCQQDLLCHLMVTSNALETLSHFLRDFTSFISPGWQRHRWLVLLWLSCLKIPQQKKGVPAASHVFTQHLPAVPSSSAGCTQLFHSLLAGSTLLCSALLRRPPLPLRVALLQSQCKEFPLILPDDASLG